MRLRLAALVLLLLAACDAAPKLELPPVSYWSVTRTYTYVPEQEYGQEHCPEARRIDPSVMSLYAGAVTLLVTEAYALDGTLDSDGGVTLYSQGTLLHGKFDEDAFTAAGKEWHCPVRYSGNRYEGPAICEITTPKEEARLKADVDSAIRASNLPQVKAFLQSRENRRALWAAAVSAATDEPRMYEWSGEVWIPLDAGVEIPAFVFPDKSRLEIEFRESETKALLKGSGGWLLAMLVTDGTLTLALDSEWTVKYSISWGYSEYPLATVAMAIPTLLAYETPVGLLASGEAGFQLDFTLPDHAYGMRLTYGDYTLIKGETLKVVRQASVEAYCTNPGAGLLRAFPELLEEMGICTVESKDVFPRECMVEP